MKLTQRRIEELRCPPGKRDVMVFDDEQRGLGVRVTANGGKTFLAQYTLHGVKRRVPLGSCGAVSLAAARDAAQAIMGDVAKGRDPAKERKAAALQAKHEVLSLDGLISQWSSRHLVHRRARYASEATRALRYAFGKRLDAPAAALTKKAVRATLNAIVDDGRKPIARLTAAYGSALYSWAVHPRTC
jgi:hypothetical protein